jgi:hypothetical protein
MYIPLRTVLNLRFLLALLFWLSAATSNAQSISPANSKNPSEADTLTMAIERLFFVNPDSTVYYAEKLISIAEKTKNDSLMVYGKQTCGEGYRGLETI